MTANDNVRSKKILKFAQLEEKFGITYTRRHLQRMEDDKRFPKRVQLGMNRVGWVTFEIEDWIDKKMAERGLVL